VKLVMPNLPVLNKESPKLGEALKVAQAFINRNTVSGTGNRVAPPPLRIVNPTVRPG
jgi:hypothetical protein